MAGFMTLESLGRPVVLLLAVVATNACVQIRLLDYPETSALIEYTETSSIMHAMARSMARLDELADEDDRKVNASERKDVLEELSNLRLYAQRLKRQPPLPDENRQAGELTAANHLMFDDYIDDFLEQVKWARSMVQGNPPNYYGVGQLTGECGTCHRMR